MHYTVEVDPEWDTIGLEDKLVTYKYRLEINREGKIIGGTWISENYPDFMWRQEAPKFYGRYEALGRIYRQATAY